MLLVHRVTSRARGLWLAPAILLFGTPVTAAPEQADSTRRARETFQQAAQQYRRGDYGRALASFEASLSAARRPSTLFNIAQCHRQLDHSKKALKFYRLYLAEAGAEGRTVPHEKEVRGHIRRLESQLAAGDGAAPGPSPQTQAAPAPALAPVASGPSVTDPTQPPIVQHEMKDTSRPFYKTWWFWTAVGVAVAGGVGITVALTTGGSDRLASDADGRFTPESY